MASSHKYNRPWVAWVLLALGIAGALVMRFREHRPPDAAAEEVPLRSGLPLERIPRTRDDTLIVKTEPRIVSSEQMIVRNRTRDPLPDARHFYERIGTDDGNIRLNVPAPIAPVEKLDSLPGGQNVTVSNPLIIVR
jgi:hypothetical protein